MVRIFYVEITWFFISSALRKWIMRHLGSLCGAINKWKIYSLILVNIFTNFLKFYKQEYIDYSKISSYIQKTKNNIMLLNKSTVQTAELWSLILLYIVWWKKVFWSLWMEFNNNKNKNYIIQLEQTKQIFYFLIWMEFKKYYEKNISVKFKIYNSTCM